MWPLLFGTQPHNHEEEELLEEKFEGFAAFKKQTSTEPTD